MIDKELLKASVEKAIEGTDLFIVDIKVSPQNEIVVELDSPGSIDIDTCAAVTRAIEKEFDRDVEDYELEEGFTFEYPVKYKEPGAKRPTTVMQPETLAFSDAKMVRYLISFK